MFDIHHTVYETSSNKQQDLGGLPVKASL